MVYCARSGIGTGVAVGRSVGMIAVSVGGTIVGDASNVAVGGGAGAGAPHEATKKDRRIAKKVIRRIGVFYWLWGTS